MIAYRVIGILVALAPVGLAIVWIEVYALRMEQKIADMADRHDRLAEVNARLRARVAEHIDPQLLAAMSGEDKPDPSVGTGDMVDPEADSIIARPVRLADVLRAESPPAERE